MDPQRKLLFIALPLYSALFMLFASARWLTTTRGMVTFFSCVAVLTVIVLSIEMVLIRRSHRA